ncbi:metallophosphoesterase family protein [Calycomorphotria hydatis]|uniref:Uncharacterized protein n=1 Tax=Calycomorphotria hydatis TaxID=2528027 RepID=A0A517TBY9_9PLAN|nr:hypothetical protein [Calycomorphotria hydatis]QDT65896.1 hypothetical protein V22_31590 [Calycomorphotria hydatis]
MDRNPLRWIHATQVRPGGRLEELQELTKEQQSIAAECSTRAWEQLVQFAIQRDVNFLLVTNSPVDQSVSLKAERRFQEGLISLSNAGIPLFWGIDSSAGEHEQAILNIAGGLSSVHIIDASQTQLFDLTHRGGCLARLQVIRETGFGHGDPNAMGQLASDGTVPSIAWIPRSVANHNYDWRSQTAPGICYIAVDATSSQHGHPNTGNDFTPVLHTPAPLAPFAAQTQVPCGASLIEMPLDSSAHWQSIPLSSVRRVSLSIRPHSPHPSQEDLIHAAQEALQAVSANAVERLWLVNWTFEMNEPTLDYFQSREGWQPLLWAMEQLNPPSGSVQLAHHIDLRLNLEQLAQNEAEDRPRDFLQCLMNSPHVSSGLNASPQLTDSSIAYRFSELSDSADLTNISQRAAAYVSHLRMDAA